MQSQDSTASKIIVFLIVAASCVAGWIGWVNSPPIPPGPVPVPPGVREWIVLQNGLVIDFPELVATAKVAKHGEFLLARYPAAGPPTFLEVAIGSGDDPIDPPGPVPPSPPPDDPSLSPEAKAAKAAAVQYFRDVATNYRRLSDEKFSTVTEAMARGVELDAAARRRYSDSLKEIMRPKLGDDKFPAEGSDLFRRMAEGFEVVR